MKKDENKSIVSDEETSTKENTDRTGGHDETSGERKDTGNNTADLDLGFDLDAVLETPRTQKKEDIENTLNYDVPTRVYESVRDTPEVTRAKEKARRKKYKKRRRFKIWTVVLVILVLLELIIGSTGLYLVNEMVKSSPELVVSDFVSEESSKIYDDQGQLITEVGLYLRENIPYEQYPESLVDSFLAIEDSRFFTHFGFDIPRFTKAALVNLRNGDFGQGGSTFTMQLVKNTYFSVDATSSTDTGSNRVKSIEYKVQQIYLAIKLEKEIDKKQIFQLYLNKLNFGGNIRGVQRASQYYFGKNCSELSLPESAMLAGIVNLPNRYNPKEYLDYGTTRRNEVLYQLYNHGYITETEYSLAKAIKVEDLLVGDNRQQSEDSQYQAYLDVVLDEVQRLTGQDPTIKGMKIYTYLNRSMQEEIEAIQNEETEIQFPDELMQVSMICMNNQNGAIVGVGGGRNYDGARLLNRATMNFKQPGSTVKPILSYALAFEYLGYSMDEVLVDKPITYPLESRVLVNATGRYDGDISIEDAVGWSLNIPAILTLEAVMDKIGSDAVASYLQSIGFSRVTKENMHYSYAIGGTTFETTPEELAGAHAMILNGGVYNQPHTISKIVMISDGSEYYPENQNRKIISSGSAWMAAELMRNNVTGPYINFMQLLARSYPVYAKTGTTDWGTDGIQYGIPRGAMKDKWMCSSTAEYTNCVWVGYDMAVAGKGTYFNSYKSLLNLPGRINKLLLDAEEEAFGEPGSFEMPSDVEDVQYVYGTYPHVRYEDWMDSSALVTSKVSKAGLEAAPLVSSSEYIAEKSKITEGQKTLSAHYDQYGNITVSWNNSLGLCSGGTKDISLHDAYNDIEEYGACLVDLSWLFNNVNFWGTVYCDGAPISSVSSANAYYSGYVGDLYGSVQVCGGYSMDGQESSSGCTIATYQPVEDGSSGGEDYSQYGYWDEQGNWIGEGWWDNNGYHHG